MGELDYFGIRPECGCVSAWMAAGKHASPAEVRRFYRDMANSGREVRRMELTDEMRQKLTMCPHVSAPSRGGGKR
jgi:hypothetical protein